MNIVIIWISSCEGGCLSLIPGDYTWTTLFHPKSCSGTLFPPFFFSSLPSSSLPSLLLSPFHLVLRILSHSFLLIVLLLNLKEEESWSKNKKKRVEKSGRKITVREREGGRMRDEKRTRERRKKGEGGDEKFLRERTTESITLSNAHLYSLGAEPCTLYNWFLYSSLYCLFLHPSLFLGESFLPPYLTSLILDLIRILVPLFQLWREEKGWPSFVSKQPVTQSLVAKSRGFSYPLPFSSHVVRFSSSLSLPSHNRVTFLIILLSSSSLPTLAILVQSQSLFIRVFVYPHSHTHTHTHTLTHTYVKRDWRGKTRHTHICI